MHHECRLLQQPADVSRPREISLYVSAHPAVEQRPARTVPALCADDPLKCFDYRTRQRMRIRQDFSDALWELGPYLMLQSAHRSGTTLMCAGRFYCPAPATDSLCLHLHSFSVSMHGTRAAGESFRPLIAGVRTVIRPGRGCRPQGWHPRSLFTPPTKRRRDRYFFFPRVRS
jgi:hypothetical protein